MRTLGRISLLLSVLAGGALLYALIPDTTITPVAPDPAPTPPRSTTLPAPEPLHEPVRRSEPPPRALRDRPPAPGEAFRSDRPRPVGTAGQTERLPPADPATWAARRSAMEAEWREGTLAAARGFAEAGDLSEAEEAAMLAILEQMHEDVASVRAELASGTVIPIDGRRRLNEIRLETRAALEAELGADRTSALREHLVTEVRGGGF